MPVGSFLPKNLVLSADKTTIDAKEQHSPNILASLSNTAKNMLK